MKIGAILAAIMLFSGAIAVFPAGDCYGARLGGGKSFGSKPFMNKAAPAPLMRRPAGQQTAQPVAAPARPGAFGGMGGLFGGLLAGTLLGSLLSGTGFGGAGGFLDLLLLALLAFVGWKLFLRFRQRQSQAPAPAGAAGQMFENSADSLKQPSRGNGMAAWPSSGWEALAAQAKQAEPVVNVPPDFNVDEFLRGAKAAYARLQSAWDKRDLADIARFATPAVMRELNAQAKADPGPSSTEIMLVNARLEGFEIDGNEERASVYFDVLMREEPSQPKPEEVQEIWHFVRTGKNGEWKLDGLQQTR